jgi:hypothetical protein
VAFLYYTSLGVVSIDNLAEATKQKLLVTKASVGAIVGLAGFH